MNQQTIFKINLGIFRHIQYHKMSKFGKIRNNSGKTSTHRAENIFPKYLLYNVHEIARKYPREKKRYSSFSDSIGVLQCSSQASLFCGLSTQTNKTLAIFPPPVIVFFLHREDLC